MKKILHLIIVGLLLFLSGCDDFLNKVPVSDLSQSSFFKDKAEMRNWNAGIYNAFQKTLSGNQMYWGEIRSDNVHDYGGYSANWVYYNSILPTHSQSSWSDLYKCITRCNTGIELYPTIPSILESEYAQYVGQCYGMRAYMYFYSTRVWGRAPLVSDVWDGSLNSKNIPRSSLEEVKEQILKDIEKALFYLGSDVDGKYYITRATMYALLTDVYMWYHEYDNALKASEYFIDNSSFILAKNEEEWHNIFVTPSASGNEVIFAMQWNKAANGSNSGWPNLMGANNTNNGYKIAQPVFIEFVDRLRSEEGHDFRFWHTVDTVAIFWNNSRMPISHVSWSGSTALTQTVSKCIKYSSINPDRVYNNTYEMYQSYYKVLDGSDCGQELIMYRLSNIMYLRAEALNQLGFGDEALDIVNTMRERVGYMKDVKDEVSNISDKYEVESKILLERQLEFYGEGVRWFDLMRTGRLIDVMTPVYSDRQNEAGVTVVGFGGEGKKYWPIYYQEFESNTALHGDQNPPYEER